MVVRIETAGIARGREFHLYANAKSTPTASIYAFDPVTTSYQVLSYEHTQNGDMHIYKAVAPSIDGYLLARIGNQKVVKKIGFPIQKFVLGHKPNYTISYEEFDINGNLLSRGVMNNIVECFYYADLYDEAAVISLLGKRFVISRSVNRMSFEVTMGVGELNSTYEPIEVAGETVIPVVTLPDVTLKDASLNSQMPDVTIKEL